MVVCAVNGCTNNTAKKTSEKVRYSSFPKNEVLQKIWLSRCGKKDVDNAYAKKMYVCSKHFKQEDLTPLFVVGRFSDKRFLKKDAVPTLYLPESGNNCMDSMVILPHELDQATGTTVTNLANKGKSTNEFDDWMEACVDSAEHIRRLRSPLVCPLHFNLKLDGKPLPPGVPVRNLKTEDIKILKQEMASVNQLVAEWMILTQRNNPELVITSNMLKAKAKEVAVVMKMHYFPVEIGWLHGFEMYLNLNGIRHWRKRAQITNTVVTENVDEPKDCDVEVEVNKDESMADQDSEQSIRSYKEALDKVKLLEDYAKRTANKCAIELIEHMQEILINTLE